MAQTMGAAIVNRHVANTTRSDCRYVFLQLRIVLKNIESMFSATGRMETSIVAHMYSMSTAHSKKQQNRKTIVNKMNLASIHLMLSDFNSLDIGH